jgi:hypothetical protein
VRPPGPLEPELECSRRAFADADEQIGVRERNANAVAGISGLGAHHPARPDECRIELCAGDAKDPPAITQRSAGAERDDGGESNRHSRGGSADEWRCEQQGGEEESEPEERDPANENSFAPARGLSRRGWP